MLTLEQLVHNLRKVLRDNYQAVGDSMIAGGAKNYEQYKYMMGQAHAYRSIDQSLTEILQPKTKEKEEEVDVGEADNVIKFGRDSED